MANESPAPIASLLDTFNNSICGLEDAMGRINESMLNEPSPTGIADKVELGFTSKKMNALYDMISRIDCVTAALNRASSDLYKL
jgi:hypothetical protein